MHPYCLKSPVAGVASNPLFGLRSADMVQVRVGVPLRDLAPFYPGPLACRYNGEWLLRDHWGEWSKPGDVIEWHPVYQDKEDIRGLLQVAAIVVAFVAPELSIYLFAANLAFNLLVPPTVLQPAEREQASPTFSASIAGNQARMYQPIPKICGRHKVSPPFAAQPYVEYDEDDKQFFYALYAVSVDDVEIESALIDDTDIHHFSDVLVAQYLPPGTPPTTVNPSVVTSPEVAGQELITGVFSAPIVACGPRLKAKAVAFDIVLNGLGVQDESGLIDKTVEIRFQIREVNEFGVAISAWSILEDVAITEATANTVRRSFRYELDPPIRPEGKVVRTDIKDQTLGALNTPTWSGFRAYLDAPAPLNVNTGHYELVLRASEQLSAASQRGLNLIVRAKCRPINSDLTWGEPAYTRNPAFWLADLWSSTTWGESLPDGRIDLQTLYDLSLVWTARQDRFDFVFESPMDAWAAAQLIAGAGRARCFRRFGVNTLARDQPDDLPVTAFSPRNTLPGSMVLTEQTPKREVADGVILEYFDNRAWDWLSIDCPCPGVSESDMQAPVIVRKPGVTGATHARREGLYEAAQMALRTRVVRCKTELQRVLVAYLDPVRWQPEIAGYGQSGDVVFWDETDLQMGLSEPPVWSDSNYLTLIRDDGSLTDPIPVTPGTTKYDVRLLAAPDFELVLDDGTREPPKFLFGSLETGDELVKISRISEGGKGEDGAALAEIEAVVDDPRVHTADNAYLPGSGPEQDPTDPGAAAEGGDDLTLAVVNVADIWWYVSIGAADNMPSVVFHNNGQTEVLLGDVQPRGDGYPGGTRTSEWLFVTPVEPIVAGQFEINVTPFNLDAGLSSATGTWLSLDTDRTFVGITDGFGLLLSVRFTYEIREISTGIIQGTGLVDITAEAAPGA